MCHMLLKTPEADLTMYEDCLYKPEWRLLYYVRTDLKFTITTFYFSLALVLKHDELLPTTPPTTGIE